MSNQSSEFLSSRKGSLGTGSNVNTSCVFMGASRRRLRHCWEMVVTACTLFWNSFIFKHLACRVFLNFGGFGGGNNSRRDFWLLVSTGMSLICIILFAYAALESSFFLYRNYTHFPLVHEVGLPTFPHVTKKRKSLNTC